MNRYLKEIIEAAKQDLTYHQLARVIGVHRNTLYNWRKERYNPRFDSIKYLSRKLKLNLERLINGK